MPDHQGHELNSGSRWHHWEPHVHAPGTAVNDQFNGGDRWEQYFTALETADPPMRAIGVADYYGSETYERVCDAKRQGRLKNCQLLFPNIEMRLGIGTVKGKWVNLHLLVSPEDPDHLIELKRFLSRLTFSAYEDSFSCSKDELIRLGRRVDPKLTDPTAPPVKFSLRRIEGPWAQGWVLDKHVVSSTYQGDNAQGHPQFDTTRTEVCQTTYLLKYKQDWDQAKPLAQALADNIYPKLKNVGFIVSMPASTARVRQPVSEVAVALGEIVKVPVFTDLLRKATTGMALKDLNSKVEKTATIGDSFSINDQITNQGQWNVLLIDDLYDTGASTEAACKALSEHSKVKSIYVAALT
jgi:predicted amidophosphoribosyltransferase